MLFLGLGGGLDGDGRVNGGGFTRDERADFIAECPGVRVSQDLRSSHLIAVNTINHGGFLGSHTTVLYDRQGGRSHRVGTSRRGTMFRELCEYASN